MAFASAATLALALRASWPQVRFWWLFEPLGANPQGFPEYRHRATGIVFVRLPGGKFLMGAQREDPGGPNHAPDARGDEGPVHAVTLSPFLIAKRKLTRREWRALVRHELLSSAPGYRPPDSPLPDDSAVVAVSWSDVAEFCARYGGPRGGRVLRLPTEAQWEYACRGTIGPRREGERAATGAPAAPERDPALVGEREAAFPPHPDSPNGFGLLDLYQSTWEWCEDIYQGNFYGLPEAAGPDPLCDWGLGGERVIRGGRGRCANLEGHAAARGRADPTLPVIGFGLRLAYWPIP